MKYAEFKGRYNILAAKAVAKAKNDKLACKAVLTAIRLDAEKYRLGHTKVFFRAGTLGWMEEVRTKTSGAKSDSQAGQDLSRIPGAVSLALSAFCMTFGALNSRVKICEALSTHL